MSFLTDYEPVNVSARITNKGKQKIAEGDFNISYFQIGDSEFDYNFSEFDGTRITTNPSQKVFIPLDKDASIKYPYKLSDSTTIGVTYGTPVQFSEIDTITNVVGPAGFINDDNKILSTWCVVDPATLTGTNEILISAGYTFRTGDCISLIFNQLVGDDTITVTTNSLAYKITGFTSGVISVDRNTPDLTGLSYATVISNNYNLYSTDISEQQDTWTLNIVWSNRPAGMQLSEEELSGYTSNIFVSTKEYLGYNSSSGQTVNTGTTIVNSMGEVVIVEPEDQHSLAIIHYSEIGTEEDPDKFFKYEDYIAHVASESENETDPIEYFQIHLPFLLYHRNTGSTIGAKFYMDETDYYINSTAVDSQQNKVKFRYLIDEQKNHVGKILVNHKTIIIDDQEIVAALDYKTNRRYTLPIPKVAQVSVDMNCVTGETAPLMSGNTGETIYISYLFADTGFDDSNGMHCNHYSKVTGTSLIADVYLKFNTDEFTFMQSTPAAYMSGYAANKFYVLAQIVDAGEQPDSSKWKIMDLTSQIPNHTSGYIDPANMSGARFVVTGSDYTGATDYDIEDFLGTFPDQPVSGTTTMPQFGDEQPFPGSIKLVRATDIHVLVFMINLPSGQFETTQNPSWYVTSDKDKRMTEIGLFNENKELLVIGKMSKPIKRSGHQIIAVTMDV